MHRIEVIYRDGDETYTGLYHHELEAIQFLQRKLNERNDKLIKDWLEDEEN
jgi:hypothetical protein